MSERKQKTQVLINSIIEASHSIFSELGFNKATTNKIADRAGVSIGSLYKYFPNKEAIALSVTEKFLERNRELFLRKLKAENYASVEDAVESMIEFSLKHFLNEKKFISILLIKMFETGMAETVFKARKVLAAEMAELMIEKFPQIKLRSKDDITQSLSVSFHAYTAALLSLIMHQEESDATRLTLLKKNMSVLFVSAFRE